MVDAGYDLNVPLRAVPATAHRGAAGGQSSILSVDAAHVVIDAVKRAEEDGDALVVRLYEAWGRRGPVTVRAPWDVGHATFTDLLERETADARIAGATVSFDVSPFQIVTLKLERGGR